MLPKYSCRESNTLSNGLLSATPSVPSVDVVPVREWALSAAAPASIGRG
jgi:hypothetical protein